MSQMTYILFAIPMFFGTMFLEYLLGRKHRRRGRGYAGRDTAASLAMGIGNVILSFLFKAASFGLYLWVYQFRIFDIPETAWWALPVLILCEDFCYYWFHRCQHTWAWFWAHHKLHHTEVHMNATTSFRHHWMENVYRIPFIFIPMGLFNIEGSYTVLVWDAALLWAIFTHVNLRLSMGPLTRFIAGPQVHRIHHSSLPEHQNRNFAAFFPIWDQLFGSFHMPKQNEFPPCGMTDGETTDSVWQAHFGVFKDWYGLWKNRKAGRPASAPAAVPVASENA